MKNRKINFIKLGIFLFGFSLLFTNCQNQETDSLNNEHFGINPKFEKQTISFTKLKNENNSLDWLLNKNELNQYKKQRGENSTYFDFIRLIDSSKVVVFQDSVIKTYTLPIITSLPKEDTEFFNLVIKKVNNQTTVFVIKYKPINYNNNIEKFVGEIEVFNKDGEIIATKNINNQQQQKSSNNIYSRSCVTIDAIYARCGCGGNANGHPPSGAWCCEGSPQIGMEYTFCNNDNSNSGGSTVGNGGIPTNPTTVDDILLLETNFWNSLTSDQQNFCLFNNVVYDDIKDFLFTNNYSYQAKNFAKQIIKSLENNTDLDITPYLSNITSTSSGVSYQDYDPNDPILGNQILLDIANNAIDGFGNLILIYLEYRSHPANEGKILRLLMPKMGLEISDDIPDETLGELFSLRKRNRNLVVEYQDNTLKGLIIDVAVSAFDVVALISPSRGGGAYLLASGGNRVTAVALSNLLKSLKNRIYTLRGAMVGKRIGHTYKVHGSHLTEFCKMRAINGNKAIGQWLDDAAAESFIARHLSQLSNGARDIPIPSSLQNIGRVFRKGDGAIFTPTHIRLVPSGSGVYTAYPVNSSLSSLNTLGIYIP
ncbi:hypothetical protein LPB136_03975 [Tenacibaculum todarodis]|uniref:Uncharacterized protein n=1 Tax=Tenacibaculum todarodis TaxID=1850252 RepID=A0A1L3JHI3_9FLAO|nr:hypothetical protein [Tenacibaculum todarodis]APG64574.1 hypothetical protein LPB136_03975 [Tenacibaculum todarodis]